jgi:lactoylglutathione lyase
MTTWEKKVGALTLFVSDLTLSKTFYSRIFEQPLVYEDATSAAYQFSNTIINLLHNDAAPDLIRPSRVAEPTSGSRLMLSIFVDDVNAVATELAAKGVNVLSGPVDREWGMRTLSFADPDGHVWEVAQERTESNE